jgi:uncharacterized protein YybS (DUF2232 family)
MENKQFNTRAIVETGITAAIIAVLTLMTVYVPILGMVGFYLLPIPITILYMRHGLKIIAAGLFVSAVILSTLMDPIRAVSLLTIFGMAGITLGYCFKKDKGVLTTIGLLTGALIIATSLDTVVTAVIIQKMSINDFIVQGLNMINEINTEMAKTLKQTYTSMGASQQILDQVDKLVSMMTTKVTLSFIALVLLSSSVISAFIDYIVCKSILIKLGYNIRRMKPFTLIYINSLAGALVALPMALGMFLYGKKLPYGDVIFIGGQLIFQTVFLVVGVSVVFYFIKNRFNVPIGILIVIGIFTIANQFFNQIYIFIGLADMIVDFRKINPNKVLRR